MQYTAYLEGGALSYELGTYNTPEEAHKAIDEFVATFGLKIGIHCTSCVVEHSAPEL